MRSIPGHLELAKTVGLGPVALLRRVVLPGALPGFLVGLRLAVAVAWLILVFAEQINATSGIGYLMIKAQTFFQTDVIVVCLVVYAVLGLLSDALVRVLERTVLRGNQADDRPPAAPASPTSSGRRSSAPTG